MLQVRWLASRTRALHAVMVNLKAIVSHLEHFAATEKGSDGNRAKGYLRQMKNIMFVKTLYFMQDFLPKLTLVSKVKKTKNIKTSYFGWWCCQ